MTQLEPILAGPTPSPDAEIPAYVRELQQAARYLPESQRDILLDAWRVGAEAHAGQTRKSGEPYITHPVAAATVLAEQGVDVETLIAA
ncbi:MAG: HD domain-containing protein, partial [Xanthomonadaceae bacterium]|nr:HD domain-containing protein [Xanthomonadaceae bacterium]